ncbi:NAD(P)-dependent oxidoreductase [Pelagibacterium flavum]|uniref:NAD(P)-dependent oxidoreductase n=1 Tax=Pelagibacterium flavum TaxID=2984530 RepID=A0ABY6IP95_9HYPH|nr:NAD(P)-dependent oxidoreductase [Pelagibacterium sp. YIM 151497]MAN75784.1 UDP-glucose 4-epimerase [Hyphomicrobiales bacterium]UYQ71137.1 NAD(P)-dependent oxidoreductase [Pelagibacterium sp. YIM 151497]|tara:strand:- start:3434 stop:4408 length:975 start_codon:yes stop_codon:yes gene_type:complete
MKLLITGATGKVGSNFLPAFLSAERFAGWSVRALCHNRMLEMDNVESVRGSLSDREDVAAAMSEVTHVLHLAAVKESPDLAMDVGVKGMFNLLEAFRSSKSANQFILMGGDCSVGHIFHDYRDPITESAPRRAYPGCYAVTKVIEEVMLEQYQFQYGINGCCLRAPWIMEKDDFRHVLSFKAQFGGPSWKDLLPQAEISRHIADGAIPLLRGQDGAPLRRNFVHVSDLVSAILAALDNPAAKGQLFNISMDRPVDYAEIAAHLKATRQLPVTDIATPYFSNWLSNAKAGLLLDWHPLVDTKHLIEKAWSYVRADNDPRTVWYPG